MFLGHSDGCIRPKHFSCSLNTIMNRCTCLFWADIRVYLYLRSGIMLFAVKANKLKVSGKICKVKRLFVSLRKPLYGSSEWVHMMWSRNLYVAKINLKHRLWIRMAYCSSWRVLKTSTISARSNQLCSIFEFSPGWRRTNVKSMPENVTKHLRSSHAPR